MKLGEARQKMKKKIFIGVIIAVVILVLVSFTGVVGYSSVKSNSVKVSPLFKVRTNRAIGEESKDISCKYVGKGITLPFPERDDRAIMVQKVIDRVRKMDDKTFEKFIAYIIHHVQKDKRFNGENTEEIRETFNLLRISDKPIPMFDDGSNNHNLFTLGQTVCGCPAFTFRGGIEGFILCLLLYPMSFITIFAHPFVY
jgi:hypothetical protein